MPRELSAGGIVSREDKLLLVQVKNLKGEIVWTFPKGHLEEGETAREAALREVREETGWTCRILKPILTVAYQFTRDGLLVDKQVRWFVMEALEEVGEPDPEEILQTRWAKPAQARELLSYQSDLKLISAWEDSREAKA